VSLAVSGQPEPQGSRPRHSPCLLRLPPQISPPADMLPSSSAARGRGLGRPLLLCLAIALASLLAPASASESDHKVRARLLLVAPDPSLRAALGLDRPSSPGSRPRLRSDLCAAGFAAAAVLSRGGFSARFGCSDSSDGADVRRELSVFDACGPVGTDFRVRT